jgi:hypothetical protein
MASLLDCFIESMPPIGEVVKPSPLMESIGGHTFVIEATLSIDEAFKGNICTLQEYC